MANDKDFVVNGPVAVGKDTKVTVGTIGSTQEGYYLAGAAYDSVSFGVTTQENSPQAFAFSYDGTKMYVGGSQNNTVYQYTLSTAWDLSTASYASKSFSYSGQETGAQDIAFKTDGTKMFIIGTSGDDVNEYTLSTAWDVSTASFVDSFSVSSQETSPQGVTFNPDGDKMYVTGNANNAVFQYTLSTAWDVSSASYASKSLSVGTEEGEPRGVEFNSDGKQLFITGSANDKVSRYDLTTAYDLSTGSYSGVSFPISQDGESRGPKFKSDGSKMYILGFANDTVYQYSTVLTTSSVDLSTGNYFTDSPTGDYTYTFANAGDVQAFQIEATGGSEAVAETFSTTLYDGNAATQTIDNGLDLSTNGGLVWLKNREASSGDHWLFDTNRGAGYGLISHSTNAQTSFNNASLTSFNSNGFSLGDFAGVNTLNSFVSWSFKKQTKFFDVVTYTGDGDFTGRTISHSLGSVPGMILIKKTSGAADWIVYHRSEGATKYLELNNTSVSNTYNMFNDTDPTATEFSVSSYTKVNNNGDTYVAYLFAHDTASDGLIQCGSYTGNGSTDGPEINLGWQPQWVILKSSSHAGNWFVFDNMRGITSGGPDEILYPDGSSAASGIYDCIDLQPNGFKLTYAGSPINASGGDYIYMAIRSASAPAITWPTNIEWTGGSTPSTPAEGETDVYTFTTDDGGTTYTGIQSIDNAS